VTLVQPCVNTGHTVVVLRHCSPVIGQLRLLLHWLVTDCLTVVL